MKRQGFTLIELLVVIVIIGILATISVATFSGYFAKARDSERQAGVRNAATLLKTARAVESITTFTMTKAEVDAILSSEGGYSLPAASEGHVYAYGYDATGDEFFIGVCSEETATVAFVDGTAAGVTAAGALGCTANDTDPSDQTVTGYTVVDMS